MNRAAQAAFAAAIADAADASVVVVTGTGTAFCAGVDLVEASESPSSGRATSSGANSWFAIQERIKAHPAIFIAAVNGSRWGAVSPS